MKRTILAIFILLIAGVSCKKTSSGTITDPVKYMSFAPGNSWIYETQNNITATTTTNTSTSSPRDSAINGKTYHVFTNSNGTANEYYNLTGNDYYTFRDLSAALGISPVETVYLKDNANSGSSWSQTVNVPLSGVPTTIPVIFTNTITAKGISRTVNGKIYTDVIHITTTVVITGLPAGSVISDIQSYYAPKYGLIESKNKISVPLLTSTNIDQNTILKSSNIQ